MTLPRRSTTTDSSGEDPVPGVRVLSPGSEVGHRYEIESVLGAGGSAVVYAAHDRQLGRRVALKLLRTDRLTGASLTRLRREVNIAREASSPRLVRVFDIGQAADDVFLSMELVEGCTLRDLLAEGPLRLDRCLSVARGVLEAIRDLHRLGVIHRDLKPANVLIARDGGVKLADFGLARHTERAESRATGSGTVVGTAAYMSPEQVLGRHLDGRSDLYSFGVLLFEMATGRLPFDTASPIATVLAHLREAPLGLRRVRPDAPPWLAAMVGRLLAKEAEDRYPSVDAVLDDLQGHRFTRVPRSLQRRALAAVVLAVAGAAAWGAHAQRAASRFARLIEDYRGGAQALDIAGRTLWRRPDVLPGTRATAFRLPGGERAVAAILLEPGADDHDREKNLGLSILDPQTGARRDQATLADGSTHFAERGFPRVFGIRRTAAVDVDGDGTDAIVVNFEHYPYWPSYTVVFEPASRQSWVAFYGSGHHVFAGAVDVDGDGRREVLLVGPNNRMGWYSGMTAVRVPPLSARSRLASRGLASCSPDEDCIDAAPTLAWYALGPRPRASAVEPRVVLGSSRLAFVVGSWRQALTLDGFSSGSRAAVRAEERQALRGAAYRSLRAASRLSSAGSHAAALEEARTGRREAGEAGDAILEEWSRRVEAVFLARAHRSTDAQTAFDGLARSATAPEEVCLDAGRSFHLAGELPLAISWYRRGISRGADPLLGRSKLELAEGLILALAERSSWGEALSEIGRCEAMYPALRTAFARHRQWVVWRGGGGPGPSDPGAEDTTDLCRYWALELRAARERDDAALLGELEKRMAVAPSPLLGSLRAEILARLGHRGDALQAAREAMAGLLAALPQDLAARTHLGLAAERLARLAEASGRAREAREVRRSAARALGPQEGR